MKRVVVLDHGSGNLRSAERALVRVGASVKVSASVDDALLADGLVVPGVGAFAACMHGIAGIGAAAVIAERRAKGLPTLGICVGMQILFELGVEHGIRTPGISIWPGTVERLHASRLPHMGWNRLSAPVDSRLFSGISDQRFYFVHSYAATTWAGSDTALVTYATHGERFIAAVEDESFSATQFHPEKSGDAGATLLENWVGML